MASTYTLNNGIELIGTGEQSGTWGDTTNTNLQLIDTALDGQISLTLSSAGSSGSPNALPVSDGASSNGRNRLISYVDGGDLGATAFVQLTPNDAEKIIYIQNALSGSRSIIVFQGTYNASNDYEIPAGTTAVIYFNGGGTGAVAANVFNNAYFDGLRLGSVSVTAILDEDNMSSNSATALSTQQSIKAYVDSQVDTVDTLAEILAIGNTTTTDQKIQFRDTGIFINSSADGQLDLVADTEIQIAATTVDINGAVDLSADLSVGDDLTVNGGQIDLKTNSGAVAKLLFYCESGNAHAQTLQAQPHSAGASDVLTLPTGGNSTLVSRISTDTLTNKTLTAPTITGTAVMATLDISGDIDVDGTTNLDVVDIDGAVDMASTLAVGGVVTANAGVVVDNITIDGTTIALSSGDLTLDASGDINLDADGGDINFKDGGTTFGFMAKSNNDLLLGNLISDGDVLIRGNDGGSNITALTLDMSDGGAATFNSTVTANNGINVDNINIDGTTIALSSGNLTLDSAEDIVLDAGGQQIFLKDGGTSFGMLSTESTPANFIISSRVADKDIIFKGNDGGSDITAMTIDMSAGGRVGIGTSSPSRNLTVSSSGQTDLAIIAGATSSAQLCFGDGDDDNIGQIEYNNSTNHMALYTNTAERMRIDSSGNVLVGTTDTTLYNNTSGTGTKIGGDGRLDVARQADTVATFNRTGSSDGEVIRIVASGTTVGSIDTSGSGPIIKSSVQDKDIIFQGNDGGSTITALTLDMSNAGAATFNNDVTAFSDERLKSNITTIPDALSKVTEMRGVHYVRDATGKDSTGVIAQEMQKVAPELVLTADDEMGTLSVNYGNVTGYLIEAIKELKAEIEELKAR